LRWGVGVTIQGPNAQPRIAETTDLEERLGPIGPEIVRQLEDQIDQGQFGLPLEARDGDMLGVDLLGSGKPADLLRLARRSEVDLVLQLSVDRKTAGFGKVIDMLLRVKVLVVDGQGNTWTSNPLSQNASKSDRGATLALLQEVDDEVRNRYGLRPMPMIDAAVRKRLQEQLKKPPANPLPLVAEVRYYQAKKELTTSEAAALLDRLVGEGKGAVLAGGTAADRRKLLERWLAPAP
jgi:hypothetical protein